MVTVAMVLIIGLILGVGAAVIVQTYRPPPGRRSPRPNVFKKDRVRQAILPAGIALAVAILAWVGLSLLLNNDKTEDSEIQNTVRHSVPLPETTETSPAEESVPPQTAPTPLTSGGRSLLVMDSPLAKAALKASPVASHLDRFGIGEKLRQQVAPAVVTKTAAAAEPEPGSEPENKTGTQTARAETTRPAGTPNTGLSFTVHLASFESKGNADRSLARLKEAGVPAFISRIEVNARVFHRLMAGKFSSRRQAEEYGNELTRRGLTKETGKFIVKPIVTTPDTR